MPGFILAEIPWFLLVFHPSGFLTSYPLCQAGGRKGQTLSIGEYRSNVPGHEELTPMDAGDNPGTGQGDAYGSQDWFVFLVGIV